MTTNAAKLDDNSSHFETGWGAGEWRMMRGCVVLGDGCVECGWVWSVECGVGSTQG